MTTAPDIPYAASGLPDPVRQAGAQPYPAEPPGARPALALVPQTGPDADLLSFDEALRRAAPRLRRYAGRRLQDEHEAEEVVQEAMLRAFQHRDALASEDDLMAWLTVVTGRLVIDRVRVRGRCTPVAELPAGSRAARDTAEVVVARDEARLALDALEAMPTRQAAVLWAREIDGMSYEEIGARYEMSEPAVRSVLHRARRTLRREYAQRGGSLPAMGLVALAPWLRGMRAASKLRHIARRGARMSLAAVTGLAAIAVAPFFLHPKQQPGAQAVRPVVGVVSSRLARHAPARTGSAVWSSSSRVGPAARQPAGSAGRSSRLLHAAPCVGSAHQSQRLGPGSSVGVNCVNHTSATLYIHLPVPVAGERWIGVSTDPQTGRPMIDRAGSRTCSAVPTTTVTQCDTNKPRGL